MLRSFVAVALLAVALLVPARVVAQEASPAASPGAMTGVTVTLLGQLELLPGVSVPVARVELAPGVALAPHTSPGPAIAQVVSGQVDFAVVTGVANRARLLVPVPAGTPMAGTPMMGSPMATMATTGTPMAGTPVAGVPAGVAVLETQQIVVGTATPLAPGEAVAFGPDVIHTFRNTGAEPAVLLIIGELPPDQPIFRFVEAGATPAATPAS